MVREYTCRLLNHVDEGIINQFNLIHSLLMWMSESDVEEFYKKNGYDELDEEEDKEDEMESDDEDFEV